MGQDDGARATLTRARSAARALLARTVRADLDALEARLVAELQASERARDARDAELAVAVATQAAVSERLDGRVAELERTLAELGGAMSREHGLAGAAGAYREVVYLLHELRRDLRGHTAADHPAADHPEADHPGADHPGADHPAGPQDNPAQGAPPTAGDPYAGKHPRRFDYAGFERRFRGDPDDVQRVLTERYLPVLDTPEVRGGVVVDIGCGRGELLEVLAGRGFQVLGVEPQAELAAQTRARGVPVVQTLGADHLRGVPAGSLGAVVSFHVVEHLVVDDLVELLELAARALRPGGLFVAETPNPMTFLTLHESYLLDPTHVQPLHPALLAWLAEAAGFRSVDVSYHSPATSLWVPPLTGEGPLVEQLDVAFGRLNHQLYGPQDYSIVARA